MYSMQANNVRETVLGMLVGLCISSQEARGLYTLQPVSTGVILYKGGVKGIIDTLNKAVA